MPRCVPARGTLESPEGTRDLLERAAQHICVAAAPQDSGSALAEANLAFGVAKILHVLKVLGYPQDACFVATPDLTPTREGPKWQWGLSAGGSLSWGNGDRPLVFLDLRVSVGCALVGGLPSPIAAHDLVARATRIRERLPVIMGVQAQWDYAGGNHFINLYENGGNPSLPPYLFVVHGSGREVKAPTALGIGLDPQTSPPLADAMTTLPTPLGSCRILEGMAANDFATSYRRYRAFALAKQRWVARALFGEYSPISDEVHHGFVNANCAVLGCYHFDPGDETLFPITLRAELPAFLVKGRHNLDPQAVALPSTLPAALSSRITSANVVPHGGGVTYPQVRRIESVVHHDGRRQYLLEGATGGTFAVEDLHALEGSQRGTEVIRLVESRRLGEVVATLRPLLSLTL